MLIGDAVEERLDAYLILGCNGHTTDSGFINCNGIENPIVKLNDIEEGTYERVLGFLDNACGFFDAPVNDRNKCTNILTMLHRDFGIISQETLHNIQVFLKTHKFCGIYLFLIMREDFEK